MSKVKKTKKLETLEVKTILVEGWSSTNTKVMPTDRVYYITCGQGTIEIDKNPIRFLVNDVILLKKGQSVKVINIVNQEMLITTIASKT